MTIVISFLIAGLMLSIFVPIIICITALAFDELTNKRTAKLLLIPFGFIVLLKEKYDDLYEEDD